MDANFSLLPVVTLVTIQRPNWALRACLALLLEEGIQRSCTEREGGGGGWHACENDYDEYLMSPTVVDKKRKATTAVFPPQTRSLRAASRRRPAAVKHVTSDRLSKRCLSRGAVKEQQQSPSERAATNTACVSVCCA